MQQRTVEHNGVTFGKMTRRDRAEITARLLADRRRDLEANLKAAGADSEVIFDQLDQHDFNKREIGLKLFSDYALGDEGADDVLLRGLRKINPSATADDLDKLGIEDDDALNLVLAICSMRLKEPAEGDGESGAEQEKEPDPSNPATYGS